MAPPDNRIDRLLPVWPTAPLKAFRGADRQGAPSAASDNEEKKKQQRGSGRAPSGEEKGDLDEEGHIDVYA